jgi:hypothetical protein
LDAAPAEIILSARFVHRLPDNAMIKLTPATKLQVVEFPSYHEFVAWWKYFKELLLPSIVRNCQYQSD